MRIVLAATNRDIQLEVEKAKFRKDLYYRLSVVKLSIPSLKERREDIPTLVNDYIHYFSSRMNHHATSCRKDALDALIRYHWPSNIRELINVIERATLLCPHDEIDVTDLPYEIRPVSKHSHPYFNELEHEGNESLNLSLNEYLAIVERDYLARLLTKTAGRIGDTAALAKIDPCVLYQKTERLGLEKRDFCVCRE